MLTTNRGSQGFLICICILDWFVGTRREVFSGPIIKKLHLATSIEWRKPRLCSDPTFAFAMATNSRTITLPRSYVTSADAPIKIANYPDTAEGVTPIQVATLNRPEKLNAITLGMINDLEQFISTVDVDERVKVLIITGAGKAFSAGIDLNNDASQHKNRPASEARDPGGWLALAMYNCSKIIIVAYSEFPRKLMST